ncbi:MAG TPA: DUF2490 domain-containing protein [Pyrinomonadaceae bacterium]|nr:DUF2490 domain-containing protein [Pyrinomonadaceae bacterium]
MKPRIVQILCLVMFLVLPVTATYAQDAAEFQFWPEVDVFIPLRPKIKLFLLGTVTKAEETRDNLEGQVGIHLDYTVNRKFMLRGGYRYGFALSEGDPFKEHRIVLEQTLRHPLPLDVLLTDRNREDFRWVNGQFSARYRNRVTVEREFEVLGRQLTPYSSAEVYYDTRFDTWNRNRLTVGLQVPFKKGFPLIKLADPKRHVVLDLFFTRQNDSRSQPSRIKAFGAALSIYF